jgi:hypothetical protein
MQSKLSQLLLFFDEQRAHVYYTFFFEINRSYIKQASRLIKNLPVPLGTLVRKRVRQKLAACITIRLHHLRDS